MIEHRHRLDFADTLRRKPSVCLNLPLRPYSIGHELELLRLRSPFLLAGGMEKVLALPANELEKVVMDAADVCSQTEAERLESESLSKSRISIWDSWGLLFRKFRNRANYRKWGEIVADCNMTIEAINFWNYLCAGRTGPEYADMAGETTVAIGAPECAILIQYVRNLPERLVKPHGEELDYPFALARYELATMNEQAGKVRLQPDNAQSFGDWCREQEALVKAGKINLPPVAPIKEEKCLA